MKCSRCGHDNRRKDRLLGHCISCAGKFAFDPKDGDRFTDQAFKNAIDRVSSNGSVKFSMRNLFYEVDRLRRPQSIPWFVGSGTGLAVGAAVSQGSAALGALMIAASAATALVGFTNHFFRRRVRLAWAHFEADYARWKAAHGAPDGLIDPRMLPQGPPPEELLAELSQYSFDRAVITDTGATADLLLANGFHFENNCAVLSVDGHPQHAFKMVRDMLRNNPKLEVYALHDCTPEGCTLAWKLRRDPTWFKDIGRVFEVALRPAQAKKMKTSWQRGTTEVPAHPALTEAERRFLRRHSVELAAIRPEQLVKRLFRAMTRLPASDGGTSDGGVLWMSDATTSDGGDDAFG